MYIFSDGLYETVGDMSPEQNGMNETAENRKRSPSIPLMLRGLMKDELSLQIKVSKEYAERHSYYDKIVSKLIHRKEQPEKFATWKTKLLYEWQYQMLQKIMSQNNRRILWVVDKSGNNGKTFLCSYLNCLYNFEYLDGLISSRDIGCLLTSSAKGIAFDVARASLSAFDYGALESLKNGHIVSGKYRGCHRRFNDMKIVVFANNYPNNAMLSEDRWDIVVLGEVPFANLDRSAVVNPSIRFPFIKPHAMPELQESFDMRDFLESRLKTGNAFTDDIVPETENAEHPTGHSQVAGPAETLVVRNNPSGEHQVIRK